ncbi:hypothetical protein [Streptomyces sp. CMB-StM0423]|uniref:hypothetical protein n=1 Tax=Streptomyces sp. CMB-StM0423 TaxID=2059884 RepID=UPI000C70530E|nr:hypothetical protein [Streptomyces sp. CMB-StM0423]AUH42951.1 hypothetical protein CXR04_24720 [Streptomyces sp. CMB-StM0423]
MTRRLVFAEGRQAESLAVFLGRLLRYDRGAAVRLRVAPGAGSGTGGAALAVFGHAPALEVIVVRTALLMTAAELDETVSAGELAEAIEAANAGTGSAEAADRADAGAVAGTDGGAAVGAGLGDAGAAGAAAAAPGAGSPSSGRESAVDLPQPVSGPGWAGLLPPRGGWEPVAGLPRPEELRVAVVAGVAEFKSRVEALPEEKRTRSEVDRIGGDIWSRPLGETPLPLRAAHAARVFGLLPHPADPAEPALLAAGNWLRLRTPYGSVALRRTGGLGRLGVTPL